MPISVRMHQIARGVAFLLLFLYYPVYFSDGTTDVTRTMHFGTPTNKQKVSTTLTLKLSQKEHKFKRSCLPSWLPKPVLILELLLIDIWMNANDNTFNFGTKSLIKLFDLCIIIASGFVVMTFVSRSREVCLYLLLVFPWSLCTLTTQSCVSDDLSLIRSISGSLHCYYINYNISSYVWYCNL